MAKREPKAWHYNGWYDCMVVRCSSTLAIGDTSTAGEILEIGDLADSRLLLFVGSCCTTIGWQLSVSSARYRSILPER